MKKLFLIICFLLITLPCKALDIVPGLKGFGTDTRAAYGAANDPEICIVTSTATTTGNPTWNAAGYSVGLFEGTLIQCIEGLDTLAGETIDGHVVAANSGKIILFETSGTITETGVNGATNPYTYSLGNYTSIYGQTSPSPGILLRNISIAGGNKHDILIQHIRARMDGPPSLEFGVHKSFNFNTTTSDGTYNIVIDHVSASWGSDGNIVAWQANATSYTNNNITIANSIFSESRKDMGLINGDAVSSKNLHHGNGTNFLVYGCLFSNSDYRNPKFSDQSVALAVNNYSYNNASFGYSCDGTDFNVTCSYVGNVLSGGLMSGTYASDKMPNLQTSPWDEPLTQHNVYLYDNKTDLGTQTSSTDWSDVDIRAGNTNVYADMVDPGTNKYIQDTGETPSSDSPLWPTGLTAMASSAVRAYIINNAGAYPTDRDSVDTRLIQEMSEDDGDEPSSVPTGAPSAGDWPTLAVNTTTLSIPSDPHGDADSDGYTNLEEWIHGTANETIKGINF
jgi:hypothetical protein